MPEPVNSALARLVQTNDFMRSLKFAIRALFRTPFVTAVAIVSLALGIGATAGIYSVFHQVLLQSLAVPRSVRTGELERARPEARLRELRPRG